MTWLLDNSAWVRLRSAKLPDERADEIARDMEHGRVVTSLPFLLEAGYSARNVEEHHAAWADLRALPHATIDAAVEGQALEAQQRLVRVGHHRLPPIDVIIAAIAARHGLGVLHYDRDFDLLLEKTQLDFESVWLAPAGSL